MNFCPMCGEQVQEGQLYCGKCGASVENFEIRPQGGYYAQPQQMSCGMAIAGFVCSFFIALLGLIFSIVGLSQINKYNGMLTGKGLAVAGIIISIITILFQVLAYLALRDIIMTLPSVFM